MSVKTIATYILFIAFFCLCGFELGRLWQASAGRDTTSVQFARSLAQPAQPSPSAPGTAFGQTPPDINPLVPGVDIR